MAEEKSDDVFSREETIQASDEVTDAVTDVEGPEITEQQQNAKVTSIQEDEEVLEEVLEEVPEEVEESCPEWDRGFAGEEGNEEGVPEMIAEEEMPEMVAEEEMPEMIVSEELWTDAETEVKAKSTVASRSRMQQPPSQRSRSKLDRMDKPTNDQGYDRTNDQANAPTNDEVNDRAIKTFENTFTSKRRVNLTASTNAADSSVSPCQRSVCPSLHLSSRPSIRPLFDFSKFLVVTTQPFDSRSFLVHLFTCLLFLPKNY